MAMSASERAAAESALLTLRIAGTLTEAQYTTALTALIEGFDSVGELAAQVGELIDTKAVIIDSYGTIGLKGHVALVGDLPAGAADGDAYVVDDDGHLYKRVASAWVDTGQWRGDPGDLATAMIQLSAPATYSRPIGEKFQGVRDLLDFVPYAQHAAMRDGTTTYDASTVLNAGLPGVNNVDFSFYTVVLESPVTVSGRKLFRANRANLKPDFADPSQPIFKNAANQTLLMAMDGFVTSGPSAIVDMQLTGTQNAGLALAMANCEFRGQGTVDGLGTTPAAGTRMINARQMDFLFVQNVRAYDYDELLRVDSNKTNGERDNTQIRVKSLYGSRVNLGVFLGEVDKAQIEGVDIMTCGSGYYFKGGNRRVMVVTTHVENFGKTGYDAKPLGASLNGYGFYFPLDTIQEQILLDHCSVFTNTGENPLRGLFQGRSGASAMDLVVRQSYLAPTGSGGNYKAMELHQGMRWEGYWPYASSEVVLGDAGLTNRFMDLAIDEMGWKAKAGSKNLLPGDRAINLTKTAGGTVTIVDSTSDDFPDGDVVTMDSGSELYEVIHLTPGWYTFVLSAEPITGNPQASVRDDPTTVNRRMLNPFNAPTTYERMFRMPFRIDNAGNVRVGFRAIGAGSSSFRIGRMALVRNHWPASHFPGPSRHVPAIGTLPAAAERYMGQTMQLVKLGAGDDEFYVCIQVNGGAYAWKRISVV